jgi:hypothetical protein
VMHLPMSGPPEDQGAPQVLPAPRAALCGGHLAAERAGEIYLGWCPAGDHWVQALMACARHGVFVQPRLGR